jgi:flagellin-like hook-associated protein FlgL
MAIRVSSNQMVYNYKKQLNAANSRQTKLMEQGDGSKLHRPSDDSVDYTKYLRYSISENENNQYQENVSTAVSWMKASDDALVSMTDIQKTFKEKTVAAANDTNTTSDRAAIGKEMMAEIQELVSLGNTQSGDRYLFAGQKDTTQPFSLSVEEVDRGLPKTLDEKQASFFSTADSSGVLTQMLTLRDESDSSKLYYLDTTTGRLYSSDFMKDGYKDKIAAGQTKAKATDIVAKQENEKYNHVKTTVELDTDNKKTTADVVKVAKNAGVTLSGQKIEIVRDSSGKDYYGDSGTGKVYNMTTFEEVGTYPGGEYKNVEFTVKGKGKDYYALTDDDGNKFYANAATGAIQTWSASTFSKKDSPEVGELDDQKIDVVDDLYAYNQKYTVDATNTTVADGTNKKYIAVQDEYGATFYYDKDTRDVYTEKAMKTSQEKKTALSEETPVDNMQAYYVAKNFANTGKIVDGDETSGTANTGSDFRTNFVDNFGRTITLQFATVKQQIATYQGDAKYISMTKKNGTTEPTSDTVNVTGQEIWGTDIFDDAASGNKSSGTAMLNEMLTVHAKVLEDNTSWLADDAQTVSDAANQTTLKTETKLGARQQLYNNVKTMLGNQNELITQDITDVDSTDVAALAVKLMEDQTVYNLSLALGARILPQSLADYLS